MAAVLSTAGTIKTGAYVNEWVQVGDKWVNKYAIIGTTITDYAVWEPYCHGYDANGKWFSTHSTITHHDGVALGDITTRDLPPEVEAIPYSDERVRRVRAWYAANKEEAAAIAREVFPQDF